MKFGPPIWISDFWTVSENISASLSHKTFGKLLQKSREMRTGVITVSRQKMLRQKWLQMSSPYDWLSLQPASEMKEENFL